MKNDKTYSEEMFEKRLAGYRVKKEQSFPHRFSLKPANG